MPPVVFAVVADISRGVEKRKAAFLKHVLQTSPRVEAVLWFSPTLRYGLTLMRTGAMDALVDKCVKDAWTLWNEHPLHGRAKITLILAPRHGVLEGEVQDHLIWSHDTTCQGTTPGLAQTLPQALLSAAKHGFTTVVLNYCHTATAIPSSAAHPRPAYRWLQLGWQADSHGI